MKTASCSSNPLLGTALTGHLGSEGSPALNSASLKRLNTTWEENEDGEAEGTFGGQGWYLCEMDSRLAGTHAAASLAHSPQSLSPLLSSFMHSFNIY